MTTSALSLIQSLSDMGGTGWFGHQLGGTRAHVNCSLSAPWALAGSERVLGILTRHGTREIPMKLSTCPALR